MTKADAPEQLRPCDVVLKLLMGKHAAPLNEDEIEILSGYLYKLPTEKLGRFGKKSILDTPDEEFGDLIRKKIEGVLSSLKKSAISSRKP